jgi:hypothetical protein
MQSFLKTRNKKFWGAMLALLVISASLYFPMTNRMGYTNDDWYEMYDARVAGPQFFHEIFSSDRPARAYLQIPLFVLFGERPFPYHVSIYLYRLIGALALFWIFEMVWPKRHSTNFAMSLLFLLYPGFLSLVDAIDFQAHIFSLCLGMLSIALTIKAILTPSRSAKIILTGLAILLGWAYLALMEYFIGMEVFRLMWIVVLVWRENKVEVKKRIGRVILKWLPYSLIATGFLGWRLFYFQGARRATDISFQVGQLFISPVYTATTWLVALIQDTFKVIFLAWGVPLYDLGFNLRLRDFLVGLGAAIFLAVLAVLVFRWLQRDRTDTLSSAPKWDWRREALIAGFISVLGAGLPVVVANRHVDFASYSRYSLTGMAGGVMVLFALIAYLSSRRVLTGFLALLVATASLTHYANAVNAVQSTNIINNFWWQVAWRVPQFKDGTTLVASYPGNTGISEDYFVWGPANLIYSPQKQTADPIAIRVPAAVLTPDIVLQIIAGRGHLDFIRRGNASMQDYSNVLVLAESTTGGCVRVIDGSQPDVSSADAQNIMLVAPKSKISNVVLNADSPRPPVAVFGPEPPHGWCYYYEKASLAAQQGDWKTVVQLGDEALGKDLYPSDRVEWMPFLRAYVMLGERNNIHPLISIINADAFLKMQACQDLTKLVNSNANVQAGMSDYIQQSFCQ